MKTFVAVLVSAALLAVAAPVGARPIDVYGPTPSASSPTPGRSSGAETWIVIAVAALAFGAGAGVARLAPAVRLRLGES